MPAKLVNVIRNVHERLHGTSLSSADLEDHAILIADVVRATIAALDLGIDRNGEVYDPAAGARASWDKPTVGGRPGVRRRRSR